MASASQDRLIKLWDTTTGQELLVLKDHTDGVTCVAFSADGRRLVSGGTDKTVRIWDTAAAPDSRAAERK